MESERVERYNTLKNLYPADISVTSKKGTNNGSNQFEHNVKS